MFDADLPAPVAELLAPYLDAVRAVNVRGRASDTIPAVPYIARHLMRPDDVLVANELNGGEFERLKARVSARPETRPSSISTPGTPSNRCCRQRSGAGLVLIDPPFEEERRVCRSRHRCRRGDARFRNRGLFDLVSAERRGGCRPVRCRGDRACRPRISRRQACGVRAVCRAWH